MLIYRRLRSFDKSDQTRMLRDQDHNNLEAFIYRVRDFLEDSSFISFASKPMIKEMEKLVTATSSWLSDSEGSVATSEILKAKLKAIEELVIPVIFRREEAEKRPEVVTALRDSLKRSQTLISMIRDSVEQAAQKAAEALKASESASTETPAPSSSGDDLDDLEEPETSSAPVVSDIPEAPTMPAYTEEDLQEIEASYDKVQKWLDEKLAEQENLKDFEDPVILSKELDKKAKSLNEVLMSVLQKKMAYSSSSSKSKSKSKSSKTKSKSKSTTSTEEETAPTIKDEL
jgi:hypoxia up-regulated 1